MEAARPHVTIVIPVHNEERILAASLTELRARLGELPWSYEILVAENGSHDRTVELAREIARDAPEVQVDSLGEPNYGKALRRGILAARGTFVICDEIDLCDVDFYRRALALLEAGVADMVVVSATPTEALIREWEEHEIAKHARVIAGQEMGSKKQHLAMTAKGKYVPDHILMIGDAPGDMEAARGNGALFLPINPGHEEASWERFYKEGLDRFLAGQYAGAYEASLVAEFLKLLPDTPPWKRQ